MRKSVDRYVMLGSLAVLLLAAAVSGQARQPSTPADDLLSTRTSTDAQPAASRA